MNLLLLAPKSRRRRSSNPEYPITDRQLRRLLESLVWTSSAVGGAQAVGLVSSRTRSL